MTNSIFTILERRSEPGAFPLNENHWSNLIAWLLDNKYTRKTTLELLAPESPTDIQFTVDRESKHVVNGRVRFIDIEVNFENESRLFVEVKIDPSYQDQLQIDDQLSLLGSHDFFLLLAPFDLGRMISTDAAPTSKALTWKRFTEDLSLAVDDQSAPITQLLVEGMADYWSKFTGTPFEQMVVTIIEEQEWTTFYPDEFKEVFIERFKEVWATWIEERPETGNGNPHQYLLTCLSMLANRKNGFRLVKTGNSRKPKPLNWGYPKIYELSVNED